MADMRLDMFTSKVLGISRKDSKTLITKGQIKIDGEILKRPETKVPEEAVLTYQNEDFSFKKFLYILQNKPLGIVSSTDDHDGETVLDILPPELKREGLFPAGRLDKYSHGMMIITDDGKFAHRMLAPVSHVEKEYYVKIAEDTISQKMADEFKKGVYLGEGQYSSPAEMTIIDSSSCYIVIHEGIYHQVRRMLKMMGGTVTDLKRIRIGKLSLPQNLEEGESRLLREDEIALILDKSID